MEVLLLRGLQGPQECAVVEQVKATRTQKDHETNSGEQNFSRTIFSV